MCETNWLILHESPWRDSATHLICLDTTRQYIEFRVTPTYGKTNWLISMCKSGSKTITITSNKQYASKFPEGCAITFDKLTLEMVTGIDRLIFDMNLTQKDVMNWVTEHNKRVILIVWGK